MEAVFGIKIMSAIHNPSIFRSNKETDLELINMPDEDNCEVFKRAEKIARDDKHSVLAFIDTQRTSQHGNYNRNTQDFLMFHRKSLRFLRDLRGIWHKYTPGSLASEAASTADVTAACKSAEEVRIFLSRANTYALNLAGISEETSVFVLADERSVILDIYQGSRRIRPPGKSPDFSLLKRYLVFRAKNNTRLLEELFWDNQNQADLRYRVQITMDLIRDAKFKTLIRLRELLKGRFASRVISAIDEVIASQKEQDDIAQLQNLYGDLELTVDQLAREEATSMKFLSDLWVKGGLLSEFYPHDPKEIDEMQAKNIIDNFILGRAQPRAPPEETSAAYKLLTPVQVCDRLFLYFKADDLPTLSPAHIEGDYYAYQTKKSSPHAYNHDFLPPTVSEFEKTFPDLANRLRQRCSSLEGKKVLLIHKGYLRFRGALNYTMQRIERLSRDERKALNQLLYVIGIDQQLPDEGIISADKAFEVSLELILTEHLVDCDYISIDSLLKTALLFSPFLKREKLIVSEEISFNGSEHLLPLHLGMVTPGEFIGGLLVEDEDKQALDEFEKMRRANIYKDARLVSDLQELAEKLGIDDPVELLPLVRQMTPAELKYFKQVYDLFKRHVPWVLSRMSIRDFIFCGQDVLFRSYML